MCGFETTMLGITQLREDFNKVADTIALSPHSTLTLPSHHPHSTYTLLTPSPSLFLTFPPPTPTLFPHSSQVKEANAKDDEQLDPDSTGDCDVVAVSSGGEMFQRKVNGSVLLVAEGAIENLYSHNTYFFYLHFFLTF
jgi:hypothetical protein